MASERPDLLGLGNNLNRPSAARLQRALQKREIPASLADLEGFVNAQESKQIFAPPPKY